jgi:hypothetical protein
LPKDIVILKIFRKKSICEFVDREQVFLGKIRGLVIGEPRIKFELNVESVGNNFGGLGERNVFL